MLTVVRTKTGMKSPPARATAAATLLTAVAIGACTGGRAAVQTAPEPTPGGQTSDEYIAKAQADSIRYPYTAADIHFMSGMISHHAQAIKMANWVATHGASQSIRTLAGRVINAQQDEIVIMQQWLRDRRQPVPEPSPTGMKMIMNGVEHEMLMPGMLTKEQMEQLDKSRGPEFDRLFLTFMIQHHQGAVDMVKTLFETGGAGQDEIVFKLASDVNVDQITEIARMEKMLAALMKAPPS